MVYKRGEEEEEAVANCEEGCVEIEAIGDLTTDDAKEQDHRRPATATSTGGLNLARVEGFGESGVSARESERPRAGVFICWRGMKIWVNDILEFLIFFNVFNRKIYIIYWFFNNKNLWATNKVRYYLILCPLQN